MFVTTDASPARARLWNNTIVVTERNAPAGDASAVFVKAAASLELRNNLIAYAGGDNAGSAVYVLDTGQLQYFSSNHSWFSTLDPQGQHLVWNGTRVTLAKWRRNGHDGKSVASAPPSFDADAHVASDNIGLRRGQNLALSRDYAGEPVPAGARPDVGEYQSQ